jgi:hypothetical protein
MTTLDDVGEHEHSLTREEFCAKHSISLSTYFKLRRLKRAPAELHILPKVVRITPGAERAWQQRMAEEAQAEASKLEAARRRQQAKVAGEIAAESATHISKVNRERKRRRAAEASDASS